MKKLLSILLALTLCLGLLPATVFASPTMLNHVDITVELPHGNDPFDQGFIPSRAAISTCSQREQVF